MGEEGEEEAVVAASSDEEEEDVTKDAMIKVRIEEEQEVSRWAFVSVFTSQLSYLKNYKKST